MATGRKSSAAVNGCRTTAINSRSGATESEKLTRFEPTTESGNTACGRRTFRISSWLPRMECRPCRTAMLKNSQGSRPESRKMAKFRCGAFMMVAKTTV